jgi:hypothetical protein
MHDATTFSTSPSANWQASEAAPAHHDIGLAASLL